VKLVCFNRSMDGSDSDERPSRRYVLWVSIAVGVPAVAIATAGFFAIFGGHVQP
jgi:hypothetical protein